jgi:hypothetical protein
MSLNEMLLSQPLIPSQQYSNYAYEKCRFVLSTYVILLKSVRQKFTAPRQQSHARRFPREPSRALILSESAPRIYSLCSLFTMKLYNGLIKTMNNVNVNSHHKNDETASRRLSNDSTVPPSTMASSSRRSSMANSLPDANECHDYPLDNNHDGASFMRSSFEQRRSSGSTSTALQAREATGQRSKSSPFEGGTTDRNGQSDIPRTLNRKSSWGNLSIEDI